MKKIVAILIVLGLFSFASPEQSKAHSDDWGWFAAGAAAGIITGAVLADSSCGPTYYREPCYRPVVYRPVYRPSYYRTYSYPRYSRGYYYDEYCD